jgi:ornithine--oxo-acid transaminase
MNTSIIARNHRNHELLKKLQPVITELNELFPEEKDGHTWPELIAMQDLYGGEHYRKDSGLVVDHAEGVHIWDMAGKKYLDMNATYSAIAGGHANVEMITVIMNQMLRITSTQNKLVNDKQPLLLKRICELTDQDKAILMNTGAEAVDTAVKAARRWAYNVKGVSPDRAEIISAVNGFQGRTINAVSMSSVEKYREGFGPFSDGYKTIPFGNIEALERAITPYTAAFVVEVIQGEGGINIPPDDYIHAVWAVCKRHSVLLIFDEVQTGLGRTGKLFASEWYGVKPDGVILGKALGQYLPVSAFAARKDVIGTFTHGSHGSTFGGTVLSCAAALKSLEMITRDDQALVKNSHDIGEYFLKHLLDIGANAHGKGLFVGISIDPKKSTAEEVCHRLLDHGIIAGAASNNVVRFSPSLIIGKKEINWAIPRIADALAGK